LIAHVDAEAGFSGGEVQVFLLMEGLRRRGHRSLLVCPPGSAAAAEAGRRGIDTALLPLASDLDLPSVLRAARLLARRRPDLVHLHTGRATWLGGLAARLARVPALTTRRMDRKVAPGWKTRLVYRQLVRRAVAISPAVARRLEEGGVARGSVRVIPSAVDPRGLAASDAPATLRSRLGLDGEAFVVLVLAALVPRKGIDVLIDAFAGLRAAVPRARLLVAGEGPERAALEERARRAELGESALFLGRRDDKGDLLALCDVLALPSRQEGLGVAALEAMAAARPVVASRVGGLAEAVEHGRTGLLVPPDDPRALEEALARLAADPELRAALGAAGPGRVADGHLPEQMVLAYEALYREILREDAA
jgi:glycosyltransferase involved in cell wall biosynthesis